MTNSFQRYAGINAKLAEIAAQHETPARWYETWRRLGPDSTDEQRLAVFQAIRDAGALSADAGFHLVAWQIEQILMVAEEEELWEIHEQLDAIRQDHGLAEDEDWLADEAPPDYQELNRQYEDAYDDLYRRLLERHGEHVMAQLYFDDQDEFDRRWEAGRRFFHPPQEASEHDLPGWLALLVDIVATSMEFDGPAGPLGIQWGQDDDRWLVTVYPTPVELVGGATDGEVVSPGFSLDLDHLQKAFLRLDTSGWNALGLTAPDGPHLYLEGNFQDHEVLLRILAEAPEDEGPGMKVSAQRSMDR